MLIGLWLALLIICPGFCEPSAEQDFGLATAKPAPAVVTAPAPAKKVEAPAKPKPKKLHRAHRVVRRPAAKAIAPKAQVSAPTNTVAVQKPAVPAPSTPQPIVKPMTTPPAAPVKPVPTTAEKPREDKIALLLKEAEERKPAPQSGTDWAKTGLRTILSLAFVLALAYVTILMLKRLSDKRDSKPQGSKNLEIVDTLKLNTNSSIHLINVRGKTLLIGSTAGQINVLSEIESDESAEEPQTDKRFAEYLDKYYNDGKYAGPATRMAGLLRDAAQHLRGRQPNVAAKINTGDSDES